MHSFELWLGWVGGYITCRRIFCVEVSICYHGLEEFRFNTLVVFECLSFVSFNKYYIRVQIPNQSPPLNRTLPIHPYDNSHGIPPAQRNRHLCMYTQLHHFKHQPAPEPSVQRVV